MTDSETPPKYNVSIVEAVILEVVAELHPKLISAGALLRRIVNDLADAREVATGSRAIHNLRESGLFTHRDDGKVEPTPAGLHAVRLLAKKSIP
ncbi:MAG TPA: hypothetical protein VNP96_05600 [Solirubrobacterales bacterium]|nr:hypothetical protein [Solirubrobacterales bacterium]